LDLRHGPRPAFIERDLAPRIVACLLLAPTLLVAQAQRFRWIALLIALTNRVRARRALLYWRSLR
jgi:hypothetical protein